MGSVGIEGGFVASIGLQESANGQIPFDSPAIVGKSGQVFAYSGKFLSELHEVQLAKTAVGFEQRLEIFRHG
ncbi:hypothetical protein D3C73_1618290 [compost metagenome]